MVDMPIKRRTKGLGYIPDLPDRRDYYFALERPVPLPPSVDLRPNCPPVYNQGELGSCTANALAAICQYDEIRQRKASAFVPSRLFIYYNERDIIHQTGTDSGSSLRDGIKCMSWYGFCDENLWPYQIEKFTQKPDASCYTAAAREIVADYRRVRQSLNDLRTCLYQGYPIAIGIMIYDSFFSPQVTQTGKVPMPDLNETEEGGHAVVIVGYDDASQQFTVRNSWGPKWGQQGYFTLPYEYVLDPDLTGDMWVIRTIP